MKGTELQHTVAVHFNHIMYAVGRMSETKTQGTSVARLGFDVV